ncbi:MAG: hypothetical protein DRO00_10130 [Thermoproteota archaeon]|nr:MAG: hypothetical protein DRO00_10130 [Candidatus Korarchaeota archaeon]
MAQSREHKAIEKVFKAAGTIISKIKGYAESRGRKVWVGSQAQTDFPYPTPKLDFVTASPSTTEIRGKEAQRRLVAGEDK